MRSRRPVLARSALASSAVAALAAVVMLPAPAAAAPLPNASREVRIKARDERLDRVLETVFGILEVPMQPSTRFLEQSQRTISGDLAQPADMLLQELARTYQFVTYYDGSVAYVATPGEMRTLTYPLDPAQARQVMSQARDLGMTDARNTLRASTAGTLAATGLPAFIQQVEGLVRGARSGNPPPSTAATVASVQPAQDFKVFYLRYAWAQDTSVNFAGRESVVPGVTNILRSLVDLPPVYTGRARQTPTTLRGMRGMRERDLLRDREYIVMPRDTSAMQVADALIETGMVAGSMPAQAEAARAAVAPRIEADPRLNAVIVRDTPDQMPKYQRLIAALDVEPQALEIEATIIDIDTERMRELGINWRYNRGLNSVGVGRGNDQSLRGQGNDPARPAFADPIASAAGGFASAILGNRNPFVFRITALQDEGAAKIVSSPQVVTLSNVEAIFDNSETFYVKVAGQYGGDLFNISSGTSLRVTPHVFKDEAGAVRIKLLAQIEDGSIDSARSVGGTDPLPIVKRSSINTQALIGEGESLLIGGMIRDGSSTGESKVPVLGDIPVLGHLFKTTSRTGTRLERLFLITPRLATSRATRDAREKAAAPLGTVPPASATSPQPQAQPVAPTAPSASAPTP